MAAKSVTKVQRAAPLTFHARHGTMILLLLLIIAPIVGWGYIKAEQSNNNNIKQWLPDGLPETDEYQAFRSHFGSDEFAIVSWDGCELNERYENSQLELFARVIETATVDAGVVAPSLVDSLGRRLDRLVTGTPQKAHAASKFRLIREVITGPRAIKALMASPFEESLTPEQILNRLEGILVGKDHKTTCALLRLTTAGNEDRVATTNAILEATRRLGFDRSEVRIGGDAVFNAMIDIESRNAIHQLVFFAGLVAVAMALIALRSVKLSMMVFAASVFAAAFAQALVYFGGGQFNLVMVVMPVLIYVLTISACVHMVNYYKDAIHDHGSRSATWFALRNGWTPCVLAAITTAVGLMSLTVSHVIPVRRFGQYGAMGVVASLIFIFVLLPALFERYPIKSTTESDSETKPKRKRATAQDQRWFKFSAKLLSLRGKLLIASFLVLAFAVLGITKIDTSVHTSRFFSEKHLLMRDIAWFEERIGPMVNAEIVLSIDDKTNTNSFFERMSLVDQIQREISSIPDVGGTLSAATYAPNLSIEQDGRSPLERMLPLKRAFLTSAMKEVATSQRYYAPPSTDENASPEKWRITARVGTLGKTSYRDIMNEMKVRTDRLIEESGWNSEGAVSASFTGAVPLVHAAQAELLTGLFQSFLMAFALIGVVMMVLLRSVAAGLLSMVPNVFPAALVFGSMGLLGFPVDVGAMLTASVAMGIAVDGTLHFLTWFRRAMRDGRGRYAAITVAYQRCGAAITQTAAIAGLGLLVFFVASFQPVSQFGLLMCLLLFAAWIGDLVLLPALIASPLGRVFEPRVTKKKPSA